MILETMTKYFVTTALFLIPVTFAAPAMACEMHGGGFGAFGNQGANWKAYNPRAYNTDPSFLDGVDETLMTPVPAAKPRPSFSNAANRAAMIAKARVAKKAKDADKKEAKEANKKDAKDAVVKKAALNADR